MATLSIVNSTFWILNFCCELVFAWFHTTGKSPELPKMSLWPQELLPIWPLALANVGQLYFFFSYRQKWHIIPFYLYFTFWSILPHILYLYPSFIRAKKILLAKTYMNFWKEQFRLWISNNYHNIFIKNLDLSVNNLIQPILDMGR